MHTPVDQIDRVDRVAESHVAMFTQMRNTLCAETATALRNTATFLLTDQKRRARKRRLKVMLFPAYYVVAMLLRRQAAKLDTLAASDIGDEDLVMRHFAALDRGWLPRRYVEHLNQQIFGAPASISATVHQAVLIMEGKLSATEHAIYSQPLVRMNMFKLLDSKGKLELALAFGRFIMQDPRFPKRYLKQIKRSPSFILSVRDLLPPVPEAPLFHSAKGRIVYVASSSIPYSTKGYATRTHGIARAYRELGLDLHVVTRPSYPFKAPGVNKRRRVPRLEEIDGVPYHRLLEPRPTGRLPVDFFALASEALERKIAAIQPEIVVAASNYASALPALIAARRLGLPFYYEVRGMWELSKASRDPAFAKTSAFQMMREMESYVCQQADGVFTLINQMRRDLIDRKVASDRIWLMPNGVDDAMVASVPRDAELATELRLPEGTLVIGYVGSINEYEGLPDLAEACARLAKRGVTFRLIIVGQESTNSAGEKPITHEIRRSFAAAGISDWLIMPGHVPFSKVSRYYSLIDIVPVPRRSHEVCEMVPPIKPIEALAMGKTLILSSVGGLIDLAQDGTTALVFEKDDVASLEDRLQLALTDPELRTRLSIAGQSYVRSTLTWQAICRNAAENMHVALPSPCATDHRC